MLQFEFLRFFFLVLSQFEFLLLSQYKFFSFVTIWVLEFCHNLNFKFCHNLSFWVLSQLDYLSFITIWVISKFEFLSFSPFEFCHKGLSTSNKLHPVYLCARLRKPMALLETLGFCKRCLESWYLCLGTKIMFMLFL